VDPEISEITREKANEQLNKRFRLCRETLVMEEGALPPNAISVPVGAVITLISDLDDGRLMSLKWKDRTVHMFAIDVRERTTELTS
jgi:hypothetical protein